MAIRIEHLNKHIGKQHVLKDVNLTIGDGEVIGLLGPNGAGKSTLMKIMVGVWDATSGEVQVPKSIGFLPEQNPLYEDMYVREYLRFFVELRKQYYTILPNTTPHCTTQVVEDLINRVGLQCEAHKKIGQLSKGYRQRVGLAQAMIGDPELLILDEPTTGLDPQTRKTIWSVISDLRKNENMTVFLTTHYMEEAAEADYIVILDHGKISAQGTPLELKNGYTGDFITLYGADEHAVKALGIAYEPIRNGYRLSVPNTAKATELIVRHPELFLDYEITKGKMDDVFLAVTGKTLKGDVEK